MQLASTPGLHRKVRSAMSFWYAIVGGRPSVSPVFSCTNGHGPGVGPLGSIPTLGQLRLVGVGLLGSTRVRLVTAAGGFFAAGAGGVRWDVSPDGVVSDWSDGLAIHLPALCHGSLSHLRHPLR